MYIVTHKQPMVLNFSGGKDSTALALWALDTPATFPIDSVICFQTGMDWPQVEEGGAATKRRYMLMTYEEYLIERAKLVAKLERAEGLLRRANANLARSKSEVAREKWTLEVERAQALIDLDCQLLNDIGDELVNAVMPFPEN